MEPPCHASSGIRHPQTPSDPQMSEVFFTSSSRSRLRRRLRRRPGGRWAFGPSSLSRFWSRRSAPFLGARDSVCTEPSGRVRERVHRLQRASRPAAWRPATAIVELASSSRRSCQGSAAPASPDCCLLRCSAPAPNEAGTTGALPAHAEVIGLAFAHAGRGCVESGSCGICPRVSRISSEMDHELAEFVNRNVLSS